jgi:hypothetical protein
MIYQMTQRDISTTKDGVSDRRRKDVSILRKCSSDKCIHEDKSIEAHQTGTTLLLAVIAWLFQGFFCVSACINETFCHLKIRNAEGSLIFIKLTLRCECTREVTFQHTVLLEPHAHKVVMKNGIIHETFLLT